MLLPFFQWLNDLEFATAIRESALVYPCIMTTHLTAMALFGGMILMVDLRILGLALKGTPMADVFQQLRGLKRLGFVLVVGCGLLLFSSKAADYYHNPFFWLKMSLLSLVGLHALIFRRSVYAKLAEFDAARVVPSRAKTAAVLSLLLWMGLVSAGRWIGYYEPEESAPATSTAQAR